jgi:hypothetical protein
VPELVSYHLRLPGDQPGLRREAALAGCTGKRWRREATMGARIGLVQVCGSQFWEGGRGKKRNKRDAHFHMGPHVM